MTTTLTLTPATDLPCEGFFDADFYRRQIPTDVTDPLTHFRGQGDQLGLDPSPYFSTLHYKRLYPDWADGGKPTALDDFLAQEALGARRSPHPLIDPVAYVRRHPDVAESGMSAAGHFARHGDLEGRSPSDAFDAGFYQRRYLRLAQTLAFAHYRNVGQKAGHMPKPQPRSAAQSAAASGQARATLRRPVLLGVHDAQQAGTPILTLDIARHCVARGHSVAFVLREGGPLVADFQRLGPVFVLSEGWDAPGIFAGFGQDVPAILHSAEMARIATAAAQAGLATTLLIHELRGYLAARDLLPDLIAAQAAGARVVASFPRMAAALMPDLGSLQVLRPGVGLPPAPLADFRACRRASKGKTLFIGAGYADRRKGFDLFLDAAQDLHAALPNAGFVWLGGLDPWAQGLADTARAHGLPLVLPGFVAGSLPWYAASSVYLLTSREDPGPTTVIHAAATGTPFVGYAADIGLWGIADPLGQFVDAGDRAGFVAAALAFTRTQTAADRHQRRATLRPHLGFGAYCDGLLSPVA
ncbi:MAG: glycosyltransferase [Pseudotabrizicola sp.]|uniref:glycosyltransferase n=1 Tax=Pseudotabrizicola sp. TaxID=2939647 RepID=UPI0027182741|nr:glycosyltransferase [Pseudotabrizicola sp.]MDO8881588.1 glycosyltransferase [Pseudotabrizicola sp.]MDP2081519.1 glycosyltransferase [Pseudotabrizicola sp.]MDZ7575722.1 glycosyltransferase [Pseudotabrizicola sp.]